MRAHGNPLKTYNILDFNLANPPIQVDYENVNILNRDANCLDFDVIGDDFDVTITGFDSERDLFIKADYDD